MGSVVISGSTSGTVTVSAPAEAGTRTLTLPAATGTAILEDGSNNLQMNSGFGSSATAYGCRAWINFNGTGTVAIRGSGNVSSLTDNAQGHYTINFSNNMPDVNYAACSAGTDTAVGGAAFARAVSVVSSTRAVGSVQVTMQFAGASAAGYFDYDENHVSIFR